MNILKLSLTTILIGFVLIMLSGCNAFLPEPTLTSTVTPIPPTPTPTITPVPTRDILCPAGPANLSGIEGKYFFISEALAPVLPLPGEFVNIQMVQTENGVEYLGTYLREGPDHTAEIVHGETTGEARNSDIMLIFTDPSMGFYGSRNGVSITLGVFDSEAAFDNMLQGGNAYIDYSSSLIQMLQNDNRRLFLQGTAVITILDPRNGEVDYRISYDLGDSASSVWDADEEMYNWCNMKVEIIP